MRLAGIPSVQRSIAKLSVFHERNATGVLRMLQAVSALPRLNSSPWIEFLGLLDELDPVEGRLYECRPMSLSSYTIHPLAAEPYAVASQQCCGMK